MPDLTRWWPLPDHPDLRLALESAWGGEDRGYHDLRHLVDVLERLDELAQEHAFDRTTVALAAWFHDAVYDGERDAEERSARWAADALAGTGVDVDEVVRLVLVTEHHRPAPGDAAGAALSDADLAILAAAPSRYAEYAAGVRREYAHLDDPTFAAGRLAVLEQLAGRERIFATDHGHAAWEPAARRNLEDELVSLRRTASAGADRPAAT
ncbi:HD domain-containing protein [Nocardioides solisilvae]|uniref:HD domain-containing protein n=1 Tax=Nocardioides solisilvae TaxID=1542435 RepID=UPI001EF72FB9|nr:HD domain-containing protein [Nocardioides solisilvae]